MIKDIFTLLLVVVLAIGELTLWTRNPLHIPARFVTARALGIQMFQELGASMEPTVPRGRHVLVSAWSYLHRGPRVGDVVAFSYPPDPSVADLKRIVATGGESVEIRDGVIYVNGKPDGKRWHTRSGPSGLPRFMPRLLLPRDSYFVLGDNPAQSVDSRNYGLISRDRIIGKRWL